MSSDKERLLVAQWILERNLGWIASADAKIGVILAIDTAMLGGLAAAFGMATLKTPWIWLSTTVAAVFAVIAVYCAAMAIIPRVEGPRTSLIYFGGIAKNSAADFASQFRSATDAQLLDDTAAQIHRNAEIARDKYAWVRAATLWSFLFALPWMAAIACLVKS